MSDPLDELLSGLRGAPPPGAFEAPAAVRRRGRRRSQRTVALAGVVVLGIGTAAGVSVLPVLRGPAPAVTPSPSQSPSPLASGNAADVVLRPADLGPGDWRLAEPELFEGPLWFWANLCAGDLGTSTLDHQLWLDTVGYKDGPEAPMYLAIVERYSSGWAARNVADMRAAVGRCSPDEFAIVGDGFAGDESVLVRQHGDRYVAVVRVGDLIATVMAPSGRPASFTVELAVAAASRLA